MFTAENENFYFFHFFRNQAINIWFKLMLKFQSTIFSHARAFSWVEPVLSNEDKVTWSTTKHNDDSGI